MPAFQISTNVKEADLPSGFFKNLHSVFQKAIGKPEKFINVHIVPNQMMSFGGSTDPCAVVNVVSIGKLGLEENKTLTKIVTAEMAKIGVKPDRMYVIFRDVAEQDVGHNNTTFAALK